MFYQNSQNTQTSRLWMTAVTVYALTLDLSTDLTGWEVIRVLLAACLAITAGKFLGQILAYHLEAQLNRKIRWGYFLIFCLGSLALLAGGLYLLCHFLLLIVVERPLTR